MTVFARKRKTPSIKKVVDNRKSNRKSKGQKELFMEIWNERNHNCEICLRHIHEPKAHNFSHIKPKGLFPELKFEKSNISILCFNCHYEYTNGGTYKGVDLDG